MKQSLLKENRRFRFWIPIFLSAFIIPLFVRGGGERDFSYRLIPAELTENAGAVIRHHSRVFEIQSESSATLKETIAVTVVNESGLDHARLVLFYNKFSSVRNIRGKAYNAAGQEMERMKKEDFTDRSAIQGFSTYEDNRLVYGMPKYINLPFTVEYSYEIVYKGLLDIPDFYILDDFNVSAEESSLIVRVPEFSDLRYQGHNIAEEVSIINDKGIKSYMWKFGNHRAILPEPFCPTEGQLLPRVLLSPLTFSLAGREGKTTSWESLGRWHYDLISDRDYLSEETKVRIRAMTSSAANNREKVDILYKYLQDHTRYASIQIGIGGWQPEKASEVERLGYGDCKALTNYMRAMLGVIGIKSCYSAIYAGVDASDIVRDFPSNQFNHVILCVPSETDSIWLECTSRHNPSGYLGTFTDDRTAFLITENGGGLCQTPCYSEEMNIQKTNAEVYFTATGDAIVSYFRSNSGLFFDEMVSYLFMNSEERRKKMTDRIKVQLLTLEKFSLTQSTRNMPEIIEQVDFIRHQAIIPVDGALLFNPSLFIRESNSFSSVFQRKAPVQVRRSREIRDTIYFKIPEGFRIDGVPYETILGSRFGRYKAEAVIIGNRLRYVRSAITYKGLWEPDEYKEYLEYHEKVSESDSRKLKIIPLE